MPDNFFGGKDDLTAALGYEENGITTILFRKKIDGNWKYLSVLKFIFY